MRSSGLVTHSHDGAVKAGRVWVAALAHPNRFERASRRSVVLRAECRGKARPGGGPIEHPGTANRGEKGDH
jgi:hypothetical protein